MRIGVRHTRVNLVIQLGLGSELHLHYYFPVSTGVECLSTEIGCLTWKQEEIFDDQIEKRILLIKKKLAVPTSYFVFLLSTKVLNYSA